MILKSWLNILLNKAWNEFQVFQQLPFAGEIIFVKSFWVSSSFEVPPNSKKNQGFVTLI